MNDTVPMWGVFIYLRDGTDRCSFVYATEELALLHAANSRQRCVVKPIGVSQVLLLRAFETLQSLTIGRVR